MSRPHCLLPRPLTVRTDVASVAQLRATTLTLVTEPHMSVLYSQTAAQESLLE